jgi:hypothetical protein
MKKLLTLALALVVLAVFTGHGVAQATPNASPQLQSDPCNCDSATLVGDTVETEFSSFSTGPTPTIVGTGVELESAGYLLGDPVSPPRWDIDFGPNTIRIDFIKDILGYSNGAKFTFSSLDPQLPGCAQAYISGIYVTTSKPPVPFNVVTAATFAPHTVTVQIAPTSGNLVWQPGEYILIGLQYSCESQLDPCCPPWNASLLKDMMYYEGSGPISAPYTVKYHPTIVFNN